MPIDNYLTRSSATMIGAVGRGRGRAQGRGLAQYLDDPDVMAPVAGGRGRSLASMDMRIAYLGAVVTPPNYPVHHGLEDDVENRGQFDDATEPEVDLEHAMESDESDSDSVPSLESVVSTSDDWNTNYTWPMVIRVNNQHYGEMLLQLNFAEAERLRRRNHYTWANYDLALHDLLPVWVQGFADLEVYISENFRNAEHYGRLGNDEVWRSRHCHYTGFILLWDPLVLAQQNFQERRFPPIRNSHWATHAVEFRLMATTVNHELTYVIHDMMPVYPRW